MKNLKVKRSIAISIILVLALALFPINSSAETLAEDLKRHWASSAIEACRKHGIMIGDSDGFYKPDFYITRAEFVAMINRAFGYDTLGITDFSFTSNDDISDDKWYASDMKTAMALGIIQGYGNKKVAPDGHITREQAAVILSTILRLNPPDDFNSRFTDISDVSQWAVRAVLQMERSGYISGYDNQFLPMKYITRAETAQLIANAFGLIVDSDFDAQGKTFTNVTMRRPGVSLKNAVITGNLFVTEGVSDGDVTLEDIEIEGWLIIAGGGENSIHAKNIRVGGGIIIDKPNAAGKQSVRFCATGNDYITDIYDGIVREIIIADGIDIIFETGGEMTVFNMTSLAGSPNATPRVIISQSAMVAKITSFAPVEIEGSREVGTVEIYENGIGSQADKNILSYSQPPDTNQINPDPGNNTSTPTQPSNDGNNVNGTIHYSVTFNSNGGSIAASVSGIMYGGKITEPNAPGKIGYTFDGWYKDSGLTNLWNFTSDTVTNNLTLYAKWTLDTPIDTSVKIKVISFGNEPGDLVTVTPDSGEIGDIITLNYTLANTAYYNLLTFSGAGSHIPAVNGAKSGSATYVINASDASAEGEITIVVIFEHTNLEVDSITFAERTIHKTYGDPAFDYALTSTGQGSGNITYSSSNTAVAYVDNNGYVTIHKAGTAVISATKSADDTYSRATASYTLIVYPKPITVTGFDIVKVYDGTNTVTDFGVLSFDSLVGSETAGVSTAGVIARYFESTVGTQIAVTVDSGSFGMTGGTADASNYAIAWPDYLTGRITVANPSAPNPPELGTKTHNSVLLTSPVQADTAFALEYAINTADYPPVHGWQDALIFDNLDMNVTYYFFARYKDDITRNTESPASSSFSVTTNELKNLAADNFSLGNNITIYNGNPQNAAVNYYGTGIDAETAGVITVYYTGSNGTDYAQSTTAPINAGTYDVKVTTQGGTGYSALLSPIKIGELTISAAELVITAGLPDRALIPFDSADPSYGKTAAFTVTANGLFGADSVDLSITAPGLSLNNNLGITNNTPKAVTLIYDGLTSAASTDVSFTLSASVNKNYIIVASPTIHVTIYDGRSSGIRAIPVTKENIAAFNSFAASEGLARYYILMDNIVLTPPENNGQNWTPIGNIDFPFTGTFDGNGYTIANLTISDNNADNVGMFGSIKSSGSIVKNLGLVDCSIRGKSRVGGLVGSNNDGVVLNCYVTGSISGSRNVGGVVGYNEGLIDACYSTGSIYSSGDYAGGVTASSANIIQNCYSTAHVTGSGSFIGGIVGSNNKIVQYCYFSGTVAGSSGVGGIAGKNSNQHARIINCVALNQSIASTSDTGRVAGLNGDIYMLTNNYALGSMILTPGSNGEYVWLSKGEGKDGFDVTATSPNEGYGSLNFWQQTVNWNFTDIWSLNDVRYLPTLKNNGGMQTPAQP